MVWFECYKKDEGGKQCIYYLKAPKGAFIGFGIKLFSEF